MRADFRRYQKAKKTGYVLLDGKDGLESQSHRPHA